MRQKMKTVCQILAALAIAVAPGAAQNCRTLFFEEKAPERAVRQDLCQHYAQPGDAF